MNLSASLGLACLATREPKRTELPPPSIAAVRRGRTHHDLAGYGNTLAICTFMRWAIERDHFPTPEAVIARFNVCRATAYRWTRALAEAYGLDVSTRHGGRARG